ncbi:MAG: hypothetical protein ACE5PV_22590 [Candidatus Poribacteria bacterium]
MNNTECGARSALSSRKISSRIHQSTCSNNATAVNDKGTKLITRPQRGGKAGPGSNGWTPLSLSANLSEDKVPLNCRAVLNTKRSVHKVREGIDA